MNSIFFEELHVLPKYPSTIWIQWRLNNNSFPENYFFDIYISDNPVHGFIKINEVPLVNTYFYEHPFPILVKEEYLYVKIKVSVGDISVMSEAQGLFYNLEIRQYLAVKEIMRKKELQRKLNVGVKSEVYKQIIFGAPCPSCIDIHTGLGTDSHCVECFGTKKLGGYHAPIESWVEVVEDAGRDIRPSQIGNIENRFAVASLTFPIVQKGDIIVERQRNRRWYVNGIEREALQTVPIDQRIGIRQLSPKDIEYRLGREQGIPTSTSVQDD